MKTGRKMDVLIENRYNKEATGLQGELSYIVIWADADNKELIESVEGIQNVIVVHNKIEYWANIDPRYDPFIVCENIAHKLHTEGKIDD